MHWKEACVRDTLRKYALQERDLQEEIFQCENKRLQIQYERGLNETHKTPILAINNEDARTRNRNLLQDLERVNARLRTTASFTPTDEELEDRALFYKRSMTESIISES